MLYFFTKTIILQLCETLSPKMQCTNIKINILYRETLLWKEAKANITKQMVSSAVSFRRDNKAFHLKRKLID